MSTVEHPRFITERFACPDSLETLSAKKADIISWLEGILGYPKFETPPPLNLRIIYQADDGGYWRRKVCYGNLSDDPVWAWLLVPKELEAPAPAVICLPGSFMTPNWGKDGPAGLAGPWDAGNPEAYGADLAKLGYITLCPDYPCAGERTTPGLKPYDTAELDRVHPEWTRVGLSAWDVSRAVDFLLTIPEVNGDKIACTGWSQGGQMTVLGGAFDHRISVLISVCGWSPLHGLSGPVVDNMVQSYNFPHLRPFAAGDAIIPYDFDHVAALIAPRPFLDIRADADQYFPNVKEIKEAERELTKLYGLIGQDKAYKTKWFNGKHAYTAAAARESQAWLHRFLYS